MAEEKKEAAAAAVPAEVKGLDEVAGPKVVLKLQSGDGDHIDIPKEIAVQSELIKTMVEGDRNEVEIPLPNVKSKILEKVIFPCFFPSRFFLPPFSCPISSFFFSRSPLISFADSRSFLCFLDLSPLPFPLLRSSRCGIQQVVDYMKHHHNNPAKEIERPLRASNMKEVVSDEYDANFVEVDQGESFVLL